MLKKNLCLLFWDKPIPAPTVTPAMRSFMRAAGDAVFETRYFGESAWWPVDIEEVAQTLGSYYENLENCLQRMLDHEVLQSPLAEFRLAADFAAEPRDTPSKRAWP